MDPAGIEPATSVCKTEIFPNIKLQALTGVAGFEPTLMILETIVLPLNYTPTLIPGGGIRTHAS